MKEATQPRHSTKPVLARFRFRRFSTVQLLIALAVLFNCGRLSLRKSKVVELIVSVLFSLVLLAAVVCGGRSQTRPGHCDRARGSSDHGQMDKSFPPGPDSSCSFSRCRAHLDCFCRRESAALRSSCAVVNTEVLCASIAAYLMLGLMWTMAYWLVDQLTPGGAFSFNTKADRDR